MNKQAEHLNLLAIFHYVLGGIFAFSALFPLIYFIIGIVFVIGGNQGMFDGDEKAGILVGWIFLVIGIVGFLVGLIVATAVILSGTFLKKRIHYIYSMVTACVLCMFMPLGTILGIFTLVVLLDADSKTLYDQNQ